MIEYRDLYDENRVLTGEKIKKGDEVPKGRYYVTVLAFIENQNHEFLLQINKKYNVWTTTGGHPKSGESSLEGIVTEIKEELGYDVNSDNLKLLKTYKTEDDFVDMYYLNENIDINSLELQNEEVEQVKWFNKEQIEELISNHEFLPSHIKCYRDCIELFDKHVAKKLEIYYNDIER